MPARRPSPHGGVSPGPFVRPDVERYPEGRAAAQGGDEIADEVLVGLTPQGQQQAADVHARAGGALERQIAKKPIQVVKVNPNGEAAVRAAYASDPRVRFVEHNARVSIAGTPNDPSFAQQWALAR